MNKVLIDTNIWVDIALNRDQFFEAARGAVMACIEDDVAMYIAGTSLKDVFYWKQKAYGSNEAYDALENVMNLAEIAQVDALICKKALELEQPDYEDGIIAACALAERCDAIVTRDADAFGDLSIPTYSPEQFASALGYSPIDLL